MKTPITLDKTGEIKMIKAYAGGPAVLPIIAISAGAVALAAVIAVIVKKKKNKGHNYE